MICLWIEVIWFSSSRNDSLQKTWNLEQIDFFFTKVSIPIYHNYMEKKANIKKKIPSFSTEERKSYKFRTAGGKWWQNFNSNSLKQLLLACCVHRVNANVLNVSGSRQEHSLIMTEQLCQRVRNMVSPTGDSHLSSGTGRNVNVWPPKWHHFTHADIEL